MSKIARCYPVILCAVLLLTGPHGHGQPKINSFSPVSGPVGTSILISGTGFNATPASNTVYIGNVKAAVTGGTATTLTAIVPAGTAHMPITVLNTGNGLAGSSVKSFVTTFTNPFGNGLPANFYLPQVNFSFGIYNAIAVGDLDRDGKPEIITAGYSGIVVQRNISTTGSVYAGSFAPGFELVTGEVRDVTLSDVDGDGKLDVVGISASQGLLVFKNNSAAGSLTAASFSKTGFPYGTYPVHVAAGDLDGDGKPELVTNDLVTSSITILRNTTTQGIVNSSSFATGFDLRVGSGSMVIRDLDGDGKAELTAATNSSSGIVILRNISTPGSLNAASFASPLYLNSGSNSPYSDGFIIDDLDGDGKPDIANASADFNTLSAFRNTSLPGILTNASFETPVNYSLSGNSGNATKLAAGDVDGDGKVDLLANNTKLGGVSILRNTSSTGSLGSSSFAAAMRFETAADALAVADLDGDGIPEIVSAFGGLTVLHINNTVQQPVITAFSPTSAQAGTPLTITGYNFNSAAAKNIVYFGAVSATVTSASATSITVIVPPGATSQPLSTLNTDNGLTGYSTRLFYPAFTNPYGAGPFPSTFYQATFNLTAGRLPYYATLSDLNNDGKPDLVVTNANDNTISILKNTSSPSTVNASSFNTRINLPVGVDPRAVAVGDLNSDGRPDIVVANAGSGTITVFANGSTSSSTLDASSFTNKADYPTGANPFSVAIDDVDDDGRPDIIVANLSSGTVSVFRNLYNLYTASAPPFAPRVDYAVGNYPRSVAVSDLDGDGKADIAVVNERSNTVSVLRNTVASAGIIDASSFSPMTGFATGNNPNCIAAGDIDGDGKNDLVVCNYGSNSVSVLRNTAAAGSITAASFADKIDFSTGAQPFFVALGEADGDGKGDLIVASTASNSLSVLRNKAFAGSITAASFETAKDFATGGYPTGVATGDLDGDGITELMSVNAGADNISVLSYSIAQPPAINGFSPESGPAGTTITITGTNFNEEAANNTVYFGAVKALVLAGSSTMLTVSVPAGATYHPIAVLDNTRGLSGSSSKPFIPTFTNPLGTGVPVNFYRSKIELALDSPHTFAVATGDLDGDGKPELVAVTDTTHTISILRNTATSGSIDATSFAGKIDLPTGYAPRAIGISDLDGDGRLDLIVSCPNAYTISIYRNMSTSGPLTAASFGPRTDFRTAGSVYSFATGDLNGDGKPELVIANASGNAEVWRNASIRGFISANSFPILERIYLYPGFLPRSVTLGDIDGDGKPDVVVGNEQSGTVSVMRNTGSAQVLSFANRIDFTASPHLPAVSLGDVDGDGKPDLVTASYSSSTVSVLRNTSTVGIINEGSFAPKVDFTTGLNPFYLIMGDADGDGKPDLITANSNANTISVLRNTSSAGSINVSSFAGKADFNVGGYPVSVALGDLDGDGLAELAAANAGSGSISLLKINTAPAVTTGAASLYTYGATFERQKVMQLYPNPTKGVFTVQLPVLKASVATVEVFNENGNTIEKRSVRNGGNNTTGILQIDLHKQPAGVYFVKITGLDGVQIGKLVVNH
ncbi:MAG: VCBS repeat-containing protein [Williamsia sp.]|nr:VCBS repeat-containing protein [Williamsia sp.]